jgi:hypothetical protein
MPPEVAFADLQFIIEFVYRGEIDVSEAELQVSTALIDIKIPSLGPEPTSQPVRCVDLEKSEAIKENSQKKSYARGGLEHKKKKCFTPSG